MISSTEQMNVMEADLATVRSKISDLTRFFSVLSDNLTLDGLIEYGTDLEALSLEASNLSRVIDTRVKTGRYAK